MLSYQGTMTANTAKSFTPAYRVNSAYTHRLTCSKMARTARFS